VAAAPTEPSVGTRIGELTAVGEFVCGLVERMDVGPFEIEESGEDDLCVVQLRGIGAIELTRGEARAVDAVQLLANQAALRVDEEAPRVVVDVEGDREAREAYLEDLARRAADRALKTGNSIALDPMNPKARRVLHVALRGTRDIATMSTGTGRYRQVVVVPKGAPEYDEAVRYSEEAARNDG
jgi:spoIIIJ-associated protein